MTRNGRPPIEMFEPIELASSPRFVAVVAPSDGDAQAGIDRRVGQERPLPHVVRPDRA